MTPDWDRRSWRHFPPPHNSSFADHCCQAGRGTVWAGAAAVAATSMDWPGGCWTTMAAMMQQPGLRCSPAPGSGGCPRVEGCSLEWEAAFRLSLGFRLKYLTRWNSLVSIWVVVSTALPGAEAAEPGTWQKDEIWEIHFGFVKWNYSCSAIHSNNYRTGNNGWLLNLSLLMSVGLEQIIVIQTVKYLLGTTALCLARLAGSAVGPGSPWWWAWKSCLRTGKSREGLGRVRGRPAFKPSLGPTGVTVCLEQWDMKGFQLWVSMDGIFQAMPKFQCRTYLPIFRLCLNAKFYSKGIFVT